MVLHQRTDDLLAALRQQVDNGNLGHGVATGLEALGGAGHIHQHLSGEGGVVDAAIIIVIISVAVFVLLVITAVVAITSALFLFTKRTNSFH